MFEKLKSVLNSLVYFINELGQMDQISSSYSKIEHLIYYLTIFKYK